MYDLHHLSITGRTRGLVIPKRKSLSRAVMAKDVLFHTLIIQAPQGTNDAL